MSSISEREKEIWLLFVEASQLFDRRMEHQLRQDAGLTHGQFEILYRLARAPGARLRMTELADQVIATKSGLTYQITQLEKVGLVQREHCPSDIRGINAILTAAGRELLCHATPCADAIIREHLIDQLTADQVEQLHATMTAIRDQLRGGCPSVCGDSPDPA